MIRPCTPADLHEIAAIEAATAYRGVIAADRWHEPYMPNVELEAEIGAGVGFWGVEEAGRLEAVMGLQPVADVVLSRHACTRPASQRRGFGRVLLEHLREVTDRPMLGGTWAAATWAVRFYEANGFQLVTPAQRDDLLRRYWTVPARRSRIRWSWPTSAGAPGRASRAGSTGPTGSGHPGYRRDDGRTTEDGRSNEAQARMPR